MKDSEQLPPDAAPAAPTCRSSAPACCIHEVHPAHAGGLTNDELIDFLNELLEGERAGERAVIQLMAESSGHARHSALGRAAVHQARFCAALSRHIRELGGLPSQATAGFYDTLMAISGLRKRLVFLNERQARLARRLREVLPAVRDDRLSEDLKAVLRFHDASARRCDRLLAEQPFRPEHAAGAPA
jgi:hypothetical protein